ncbi:MAG: S41 family peptidase [Gemmatimonadaceae bacterium]
MRLPLSPRFVTLAATVVIAAGSVAATRAYVADPVRLVRTPAVANDGTIAFTFQDDIWLANPDGTSPRRLTTHVARDERPLFSPDGKWVAFTSNRSGNNDVWIAATSGGEARQITWFTGNDEAVSWTPDGLAVVIASNRGTHPFGSPLYRAPVDGTIETPYAVDFASAGMIRQDGSLLAFNRGNPPPTTRRGYKGNANADIYVLDLRSKDIRQLTDTNPREFRTHVHDGRPMWGADGQIYFVSERGGSFNIWRMDATGRGARQVTSHKEDVQNPSISPDGKHIVYEHDFELHALDVASGRTRKVPIVLDVDMKDNLVSYVTTENRAESFSPHPGGDYVAVGFRGDIVVVPSEAEFGEKVRVTNSPWRERFQAYSPDGSKLAFISDESLEEELWIQDLASGTKKKITSHASTKQDFVWSNNGAKIAVDADNRIFEVDVANGRVSEIAFNAAGGYTISGYSSDDNWLVYQRSDASQNSEVYLFDTRAKREMNVTRSPQFDANGLLTPDGKHVVFTSSRVDGVNQLFAVQLARMTEDPNDPVVRERLRRAMPDSGARRGAGANPGVPAAPLTITVDEAGIDKRARQLTQGTNPVTGSFLSRDGRTVYFTTSDTAGPGLFSIGVDGRDRRKITTGQFAGMTPTPDRRYLFYRQAPVATGGRGGAAAPTGSEIYRMAFATPMRKDRIPFSFAVKVDGKAEWEQLFEESWRVMKYRFYDPKMHGVDWEAARAKYKPLLKYAAANEDVYMIAQEMIGELNASHTGVSGPASRPAPDGLTARSLGFEMEPSSGRYVISHIYRNGPADREWLNLAVGDYVLAVDGKELRAPENYHKVLSEMLNEYVTVRVAKSATGENSRTVRVATVPSLTNIKYEEWVENNRDFVVKESNGQTAYVHIRSMDQPSLVRFRNEIDRFWDAKSIVVDIRYNGGGNIDQELIDILERRPYQFWNSRTGAREWGRRPRQAIAGPKVMLINARSGSDSEVTPQGFRDLGIGRIVGTPTAGAVIATGSYSLINGATIRTPGSLVITWDPTKPNNYGTNLENFGVAPDVWVENTPADELQKVDRELREAVREALRMMKDPKWNTAPGGR